MFFEGCAFFLIIYITIYILINYIRIKRNTYPFFYWKTGRFSLFQFSTFNFFYKAFQSFAEFEGCVCAFSELEVDEGLHLGADELVDDEDGEDADCAHEGEG